MPKKDSLIKKREWLKKYEQGMSEAAIASKDHRDIRTIRKGVEEARREQIQGLARIELVKTSLEKHNNSLNNIITEADKAFITPGSNQPIPWGGNIEHGYIIINGGKVTYMGSVVMDVILDEESKPEWSLLKEHLQKDRFWRDFSLWKHAMKSHLKSRIALKITIAVVLQEKTGLETVEEPDRNSFIYKTAIDVIGQQIIQKSIMPGIQGDWMDAIAIDTDKGDIRYGQASILIHAPGNEAIQKENLLLTIGEIVQQQEYRDMITTYRSLQQETEHMKQATGELIAMGLVPGQCHICSKIGS